MGILQHRVVVLTVALMACQSSRSGPDPLAPPPPMGAPLPLGWQWPALPNMQVNATNAMSFFPYNLQGAPNVSLGVQRPFDAFALQKAAALTPGCGPMQVGAGGWRLSDCSLPILGTSPSVPSRAMAFRKDAPAVVDLRTMGLDGPVKDQQQVGVCWAFALSTVMENAVRRQGRSDIVAPLHLIATDAFRDLFAKGTTDGPMTLEPSWAYDPAKACKLKADPEPWCGATYHVEQGSWRSDPVLVSEVDRANRSGVVTVVSVEKLPLRSFDAVASVLADGRAAYLAFDISEGWHRLATDAVPDYAVADGGKHAVVAVGSRTNGPRGREILIHNSWGPGWGAGGYAWISEETVRRHNIDAFVVEVKTVGPAAPPPGGTAGGFPFPLPIPGFGPPANGGAQPSVAACAAGQVSDRLTGACTSRCANGTAPANGLCLPF